MLITSKPRLVVSDLVDFVLPSILVVLRKYYRLITVAFSATKCVVRAAVEEVGGCVRVSGKLAISYCFWSSLS